MMGLSDTWVMQRGPATRGSLLDGVLQDRISGEVGWEQITYTYDSSGRRIAKDVDGVVTKYGAACPELAERDGDQCIAEYACPEPAEWDGSNNLLRKYIHGPSIDEPRSASLRAGSFCMIEAAGGYAGTYYYHYDALGSVVALSDAAGETVQVYEYDVYGQVAASDPNHPNRFLFTGRQRRRKVRSQDAACFPFSGLIYSLASARLPAHNGDIEAGSPPLIRAAGGNGCCFCEQRRQTATVGWRRRMSRWPQQRVVQNANGLRSGRS